jgi:hypothetical protein
VELQLDVAHRELDVASASALDGVREFFPHCLDRVRQSDVLHFIAPARLAANVLHHQQQIVAVHDHVIDRDQTRMAQRRHDPGLAPQPLRGLGRHLGAMDALDRHVTLQTLIPSVEDRGRASDPKSADHVIAPGEHNRPGTAHPPSM